MERQTLVRLLDVDAIQNHNVKMNVQIEARAKALNERDGAPSKKREIGTTLPERRCFTSETRQPSVMK
jgi:hypothetical protein